MRCPDVHTDPKVRCNCDCRTHASFTSPCALWVNSHTYSSVSHTYTLFVCYVLDGNSTVRMWCIITTKMPFHNFENWLADWKLQALARFFVIQFLGELVLDQRRIFSLSINRTSLLIQFRFLVQTIMCIFFTVFLLIRTRSEWRQSRWPTTWCYLKKMTSYCWTRHFYGLPLWPSELGLPNMDTAFCCWKWVHTPGPTLMVLIRFDPFQIFFVKAHLSSLHYTSVENMESSLQRSSNLVKPGFQQFFILLTQHQNTRTRFRTLLCQHIWSVKTSKCNLRLQEGCYTEKK